MSRVFLLDRAAGANGVCSTTDFNVVISVLSMFMLLVKAVMFVMHIFWPIVGILAHGGLVGLWAYSIYAQVAPDHLDPQAPSPSPWYLRYGCGGLPSDTLTGYCRQAQASLAVTVIMLLLFLLNTLLAIWSIFPTKAQIEKRQREQEEDDLDYEESNFKFPPPPSSKEAKAWETEMQRLDLAQSTPAAAPGPSALNPMTPRTTAFQRLEGPGRDLPLRSQ